MQQHITPYESRITRRTIQRHGWYTLRQDRPLVWLQRLCLWVLNKLRCWAIDEIDDVQRIEIDTGTFVERLHRHRYDLLSFYHLNGERLLIGPDDFRELMGKDYPHFSQPVSFSADYRQGPSAFGMNVTVIPWMKGMLIVPKA